MITKRFRDTLSTAIPGYKWTESSVPDPDRCKLPRDKGLEAQITPAIRVVCWEVEKENHPAYVVAVLDPDDVIVGRSIKPTPLAAIKHALLEGCIWLSSQTQQIVELVSQGADTAFLEKRISS